MKRIALDNLLRSKVWSMWVAFITAILTSVMPPAAIEVSAQELTLPAVGVWNGFNSHLNVVECGNGSDTTLNLTLSVRNSAGTQIGSIPFSLGPFATTHQILNGFGISNAYGTYLVSGAGGSARLNCQTLSYRLAAPGATKAIEYGFSNPVDNPNLGPTAGIFNSYDPDGGVQPTYNWLTVFNPGSSPFSANVRVFHQDGTEDFGFRIDGLAGGSRQDFALGHPAGQLVGLYLIVPDDNSAPYGAFLMRYGPKPGGGFRFAFPLSALHGSCDSGAVPVSTMDPAVNWGEIANPTSQDQLVDIQVRDAVGAVKYSGQGNIPAFSQFHLYLNPIIGDRAVGSLTATCAAGAPAGAKLLVQSAFYGHRAAPSGEPLPGLEWSYVSQARGSAAGEGDLSVAPVNTYLNAANWSKSFDSSGQFSYLDFGIDDITGQPLNRALKPLIGGASIDLGLHADVGYDFAGLARLSNRVYEASYGSELLRVFPDSRGGIGSIINIPTKVFPGRPVDRGSVQVARSGHYYDFRQKKTLLIGDSLTQGWMEMGVQFNQIGYLDALYARGINAVLLWSYIGITDQVGDDRIGFDAPELWPWIEITGRSTPPYLFKFVDSAGRPQFYETYFSRLREFVRAANERNIAVIITVHDGWTKGRFGGHPFNSGNGGPLATGSQYIDLADYNNEMPAVFSDGWSYAAKNQYYQEQFCDRLIRAVGDLPNVQFEIFNEGEWYDRAKLRNFELHYLDFFKRRTGAPLIVNDMDDQGAGDIFKSQSNVDTISLHEPNWSSSTNAKTVFDYYAERFSSNNPSAKPIFFSEPVPQYQGDSGQHDGAMRMMWGTLMGGAGFVFQNDTSWKFDPLRIDPMIDREGHAARFFDLIGDKLTQMTPHSEIVSGGGVCLAQPGLTYAIYSQSGSSVSVDLSGFSGTFLVRFFDPRAGSFNSGAATSVSGGATRSINKPGSTDWVLLIEKSS